MAYTKRPLKVEAKHVKGNLVAAINWCIANHISAKVFDASTIIVHTNQGYIPVKNNQWIVQDELGNVTIHENHEMNLLYTNYDEDAE
ncbi:hypothetical protein SEA_TRIBBY_51 [Arthrobacter phage Tribby]|uniref:Uncharacterized protein n=1 Tax=Arthrobacter phage Tribby TaxID=2024279 RepID=A0A222Z7L8_9CAUD|nr:hypothetical protein PQB75_gp051 [Arthrobacter phage Tribby]ASR80502.1 hypothetical protein SEA_TRIBBY_51 [Arthrobacter phage Tribby]